MTATIFAVAGLADATVAQIFDPFAPDPKPAAAKSSPSVKRKPQAARTAGPPVDVGKHNAKLVIDFTEVLWTRGKPPTGEAKLVQDKLIALGCKLPMGKDGSGADGKWAEDSVSAFGDFLEKTGRKLDEAKKTSVGTIASWFDGVVVDQGKPAADKKCPPLAPKLMLDVAASKGQQVGKNYSQTATTAGGAGNTSFRIAAGVLPAGTTLDAGSGAVSGTLSAAGTFDYTLEAVSAGPPQQSASQRLTGTIAAAVAPPAPPPPAAPKVDNLDLVDVSILFDLPKKDFSNVIRMSELAAWNPKDFDAFKSLAEKEGVVAKSANNNERRIGLPSLGLKNWVVAGIRVDPGAPGLARAVQEQFGRAPQIRLIVQPVDSNGKVHDVAAHLLYSFVKGREAPPQPGCLPWLVPDDDKFQSIVDGLKVIKAEFNGAGSPANILDVHPGALRDPKKFKAKILAFLKTHLTADNLSAMAVMGLDAGAPEPWIFMAMSRDPATKAFKAEVSPAIAGGAKAQMLSFVDNVNVAPQPANGNKRAITCRFGVLESKNGTDATAGDSTAVLFAEPDNVDVNAIADRIANTEQSHFFNTDCVSCHTETRRPLDLNKKSEKDFPHIASSRLPQEQWNVRNFGWFPSFFRSTNTGATIVEPTITQRTLKETEEVVHYINCRYFGGPKEDFCKDVPFPGSKVAPPPPPPPATPKPDKIRWLDQGWKNSERFWFHHASQGTSTLIMPYDWFIALEAPGGAAGSRLADADFLANFGFLSSPGSLAVDAATLAGFGYRTGDPSVDGAVAGKTGDNGGKLPIGFARTPSYEDPTTGRILPDQIGFTCAACHTGELTYGDKQLRFDGGAAMIDLSGFQKAMVDALEATAKENDRFERFAGKVLPANAAQAARDTLRANMTDLVLGMKVMWLADNATAGIRSLLKADKPHVHEGFGRLDALNRIGNQVFWADLLTAGGVSLRDTLKALPADETKRTLSDVLAALKAFSEASEKRKAALGFDVYDNLHPRTAPVSFPPIWTAPWNLWAQYDGSILQPLIRNAGEALGVAAKINLTNDKRTLFKSSVDMERMNDIEVLLAGDDPWRNKAMGGLGAPRWTDAAQSFPGDPKWQLDAAKVDKGRTLYVKMCAECHLPPLRDPEATSIWDGAAVADSCGPTDKTSGQAKPWCKMGGQPYLQVVMMSADAIGTDPETAKILIDRKIKLPKSMQAEASDDLCGAVKDLDLADKQEIPYGPALMVAVQRTVNQWFKENPAADKEALLGVRGNCPNTMALKGPIYRARTLEGLWSTAPFLHNGSVPSLWALLSPDPEKDRPKQFCVGSKEFDPVNVGVTVAACKRVTGIGDVPCACEPGTTPFDAAIPGNSSKGHEFTAEPGTAMIDFKAGQIGHKLGDDDRMALIEYLKSL